MDQRMPLTYSHFAEISNTAGDCVLVRNLVGGKEKKKAKLYLEPDFMFVGGERLHF